MGKKRPVVRVHWEFKKYLDEMKKKTGKSAARITRELMKKIKKEQRRFDGRLL